MPVVGTLGTWPRLQHAGQLPAAGRVIIAACATHMCPLGRQQEAALLLMAVVLQALSAPLPQQAGWGPTLAQGRHARSRQGSPAVVLVCHL